jgi:hypothetical protein
VDIKKKLTNAKSKFKKYAPEIITIGSAVTVFAGLAYAIKKSIDNEDGIDYVVVPVERTEQKERKQDDAIHKVTGEDRTKIVTDENFSLYRIDGVEDFYYLNRNLDEN